MGTVARPQCSSIASPPDSFLGDLSLDLSCLLKHVSLLSCVTIFWSIMTFFCFSNFLFYCFARKCELSVKMGDVLVAEVTVAAELITVYRKLKVNAMVGNSITFENKKKCYERNNESNKVQERGVLAVRAENLAQDRTVFN